MPTGPQRRPLPTGDPATLPTETPVAGVLESFAHLGVLLDRNGDVSRYLDLAADVAAELMTCTALAVVLVRERQPEHIAFSAARRRHVRAVARTRERWWPLDRGDRHRSGGGVHHRRAAAPPGRLRAAGAGDRCGVVRRVPVAGRRRPRHSRHHPCQVPWWGCVSTPPRGHRTSSPLAQHSPRWWPPNCTSTRPCSMPPDSHTNCSWRSTGASCSSRRRAWWRPRLDVTVSAAFDLLRSWARRHRRGVHDVAADVVARRLPIDGLRGATDA